VWVDDQIRIDAFLSERHVLLLVGHTNSTFLAVSGRKLIADLRDSDRPDLYLGEHLAILVGRQDDRVDHAHLGVLDLGRAVFSRLEKTGCGLSPRAQLLAFFEQTLSVPDGCSLPNDDVITVHDRTRCNDAIEIELVIRPELALLALPGVWPFKSLFLVLGFRVGAEERRSEQSSIDG